MARRLYYRKQHTAIRSAQKKYWLEKREQIMTARRARKAKRFTDKDVFLTFAYSHIRGRCTDPKKPAYNGLSFLQLDEFKAWAKADKDFHALFEIWVLAGHERVLLPTVNRINPKLGYVIDNIEWLTLSANCSAARRSTAFRPTNKREKAQKQTVVDLILRGVQNGK